LLSDFAFEFNLRRYIWVGDRIPYVIVKAAKNAKGWEKSEDPIYALENNLPIDCQHYLEHYLSKPLMRIFNPIIKVRRCRLAVSNPMLKARTVSALEARV
jgi:DNA polymerase elongation subunit (family B)